MFELANTSLPNGLIPGTHGFATVAMTRGLSDALRQRLEALCAYTHRQSAHDERYLRKPRELVPRCPADRRARGGPRRRMRL